jgi:hypothetical protein
VSTRESLSTGAPLPRPARPSRFQVAVLGVLVTFLLVFPKGGLKVGGVPITWGYLALLLASVPFAVEVAFGSAARIARPRLWVLAALVPFQVVVWLSLLANGTSGPGFAISLVASFFFIPLAMVLALGSYLDRLDLAPLFRALRLGILLVAAYGIFLFVYRLQTGHFIEVPYLTVNAGDVGGLEDKYIDRGGIFKLISTYNNGNIYGVSILLLLPLYEWLEPRLGRQLVVKASLVLTLSRTAWVGLVVYELLRRFYVRRPTLRSVLTFAGWIALILVGVAYALSMLGRGVGFLFDRSLGGRSDQLLALERARLAASSPFEAILEMVYFSMLDSLGIAGLATFLLAMLTPLLLHFAGSLRYAGSTYKRSLAAGVITYLVVATSDGALLFIPVMAFYWFVVSLLVSDNPSFASFETRGPRAGALGRPTA